MAVNYPVSNALGIAADTGLVAKACRRMSGKRGPQGTPKHQTTYNTSRVKLTTHNS